MENKELLNPESDENKKEQGVENLNSDNKPEITQSAAGQPEEPELVQEENSTEEVPAQEASGEPETFAEQISKEEVPEKETSEEPETLPEQNAKAEDTAEETPDVVQSTQPAQVDADPQPQDTAEDTEVNPEDASHAQQEPSNEIQEKKAEAGGGKKTPVQASEEQEEDMSEKYASLSKAELVETVEAIVQHEDTSFIRKHIGYIKVAFRNYLKEENVVDFEKNLQKSDNETEAEDLPEIADELVVRFDKAFGIYKQKKSVYDQAVEKQKQDNLKSKEAILEELRQLIESEEELKKTYDIFKELQDKWREIGPVPQSANNTLWNNYHFLVEKFFDKVKINKELRDLDLRKNLEIKTELCEKAEELLLESSINKSFQKLQKLHETWKEIGPVPKDKKDEIWDRFKTASDSLNERRQGYYEGLREEQNKNYAAKILLCEKAERLAEVVTESPKEWQDATDQINGLFKVWKSIGFAPKKVNDEVWVRFRSALDNFFRSKKNFFHKYKDEQSENYNQKLNLCLQAEALRDSEDWKRTTDELIALQQQWKKIGPVPRKFSDKVWKRFRAACDEFFNRKSEYFANIGEKHDENLRKKKDLIEKIKTFEYAADNTENLNTLKNFQRQWMEIGHVPIKEKDAIQNELRKTINEQFDKLNISRKAKTTMGFRNKIENLKNAPNADNIIYKERSFLLSKISALQNDIKLWENNIGFFASSKKADVLKQEFEKKIENARNEIQIMEEKLRILYESQS